MVKNAISLAHRSPAWWPRHRRWYLPVKPRHRLGARQPPCAASRSTGGRRLAPRLFDAYRSADASVSATGIDLDGSDADDGVLGGVVSAKAAKTPSLGTVKIEAQTKVAVPERLVSFSQFTISEAHFSTVPKEQLRGIVDEITNAIPQNERIIALDRVLASIDASQITPRNVPDIKADPPPVFFNTKPSVLVNIDGNPIWSPIAANDLRFAVNTNWDLFEHGPTKAYFLRVNDSWMTAAAVEGPWTPAAKLPPSFGKLPADENWKAVKAAVPGKTLTAAQAPVVFVSTTPAEMILLSGEPVYEPVPGTGLQWVNNTESDVFRLGPTGAIYFLVSGRWFSAPAFKGPWTFATLTLPDDFKRIPLEHPRSRVLAAVPGTSQAVDAVLLAQIPQTARVNKKTIEGSRGRLCRGAAVRCGYKDDAAGRARGQHGQGHPQGRRSLLHVFPGRLVRVESSGRTVGSYRVCAEADLRDSSQLAGVQRDLCDR